MTIGAMNGIDACRVIVRARMADLRAEGDAARLSRSGDQSGLSEATRLRWPSRPEPMVRRRLVPAIERLKAILEATPATRPG